MTDKFDARCEGCGDTDEESGFGDLGDCDYCFECCRSVCDHKYSPAVADPDHDCFAEIDG